MRVSYRGNHRVIRGGGGVQATRLWNVRARITDRVFSSGDPVCK